MSEKTSSTAASATHPVAAVATPTEVLNRIGQLVNWLCVNDAIHPALIDAFDVAVIAAHQSIGDETPDSCDPTWFPKDSPEAQAYRQTPEFRHVDPRVPIDRISKLVAAWREGQ